MFGHTELFFDEGTEPCTYNAHTFLRQTFPGQKEPWELQCRPSPDNSHPTHRRGRVSSQEDARLTAEECRHVSPAAQQAQRKAARRPHGTREKARHKRHQSRRCAASSNCINSASTTSTATQRGGASKSKDETL